MKKLIYILLGLILMASPSCTEASCTETKSDSAMVDSVKPNVETIAEYRMSSIYGRVNVSKVEYEGKTFIITTAFSGTADGGISVNTIELK